MSTKTTLAAMSTAAIISKPSILQNFISYGAEMADTIIKTTGDTVDTIIKFDGGITGQILNPLAALYGGIKTTEFIDEKFLKLKNKYGKYLFQTLGGIIGVVNTPVAATIGTGVATYKGIKGIGNGIKKLWNTSN